MVIATFDSAGTSGTMRATVNGDAGKAKGLRKAKAAERVARACRGTDETANAYTPEYGAWLAAQAAAHAR